MTAMLEWLESSSLGAIARESLYGFQILVAIHLIALGLSIGMLLWVDMRMLGLCLTDQKLSVTYRALARWFIVGFSIMFLSGFALFSGFATSAAANPYFRLKLAVIVLAGINARVFHRLIARAPAQVDAGTPTGMIRMAGLLSILFWTVVILCGRMLSYTLF